MWLSVPGLVLYGFAALPAGWLGDRWSAERMMVMFFGGSGVAALARLAGQFSAHFRFRASAILRSAQF
jgi:hypothetical protein